MTTKPRARQVSRAIWTEEMVAIAAGMKRAGLTNRIIAARLGVTGSSVDNKMQKVGAKRNLTGATGVRFKGFGRQAIEARESAAEAAEMLGASNTIG